jgi:hypothetical protein
MCCNMGKSLSVFWTGATFSSGAKTRLSKINPWENSYPPSFTDTADFSNNELASTQS